MQIHNVVVQVDIQDNLGVPIGIATLSTTVGGSTFSVYKNYADTLSILIPSWAFAGQAIVRVNVLDAPTTEGGVPVAPETTVAICILLT
jgi:hypothetical protein